MKNRFLVFSLASLFLVGALTQGCAEKSKLDLKTVADKILKTLSSADAVAVANLYAPDAVMIQADLSSPVRGREALLKYYKGMFRAMTYWKVDIPFLGRGIGWSRREGSNLRPADDEPTGPAFQLINNRR